MVIDFKAMTDKKCLSRLLFGGGVGRRGGPLVPGMALDVLAMISNSLLMPVP